MLGLRAASHIYKRREPFFHKIWLCGIANESLVSGIQICFYFLFIHIIEPYVKQVGIAEPGWFGYKDLIIILYVVLS